MLTTKLSAQSIAINTDGSTPDASSLLDITSTTKGVLIPRMTSAQRTAISSPATGLMVYQNNGTQGLYYNVGTSGAPSWSQVYTTGSTGLSMWNLTGNSGTSAASNYVGTSDARDFVFRTNATEVMRIKTTGYIGIGTSAPSSILHVSGTLKTSTFQITSAASNGYMLYSNSAGLGTWKDPVTVGFNRIVDADTDTKIQTEESSDEDIIRFDLAGTERFYMQTHRFHSGTSNNFIGEDAGLNNSLSSTYTSSIGYQASRTGTTATGGTHIGYKSSYSNSTLNNITSIGHLSAYTNTAGSWGCSFGASACRLGYNTSYAFGAYAGYTSNAGITIGFETGKNQAPNGVNIGYRTSYNHTSSSAGVNIGAKAGYYSYNQNELIGYQAGAGTVNHMKYFSTMIGYQAGYNSGGSNNYCIFLGYQAGYNETTASKLYIENSSSSTPLIFGDFVNDYVTINSKLGIGSSSFGAGTNIISIENGTAPTASATDGVLLYAEDVAASSELKVRDEAGNVTTLSPHNFSLMEKSEPMAWSFYSESHAVGKKINVDMLKTIRLVEKLSGERLVYRETLNGTKIEEDKHLGIEKELEILEKELKKEYKRLKRENKKLKKQLEF